MDGERTGRGRGRGRGGQKRWSLKVIDEEEQIETSEIVDNTLEVPPEPIESIKEELTSLGITGEKQEFSLDDDISQLVPPTFSILATGPPQPMLELDWNQNYNPSAEKVPNPNIHMCGSCLLPIWLYGRLIPCKHVFCYSCAKKEGDKCSRCSDKVHRIEQAHVGTVHMCYHEGSRYGFDGCRRTYLSQRDLQAHINHRHKPRSSVSTSADSLSSSRLSSDSPLSSYSSRQSIPVVHSSRSNLIAVPLQGGSRVKPDSQSVFAQSPDNPPVTPSSGSRYERKSSYSQHYSRSSSWQFRQFHQ